MSDPLITLSIALVLAGLSAWIFWPQRGLLPRWRKMNRLSGRVLQEDALKHLYKTTLRGRPPGLHSIAGALNISPDRAATLLAELEAQDLLRMEDRRPALTPLGEETALHIIRAHRLWERFLAEKTGYGEEEWHDLAETYEHRATADELNVLAAQLGYPTHDPHGDPIPTEAGELVTHDAQPLTHIKSGELARIVHLEDEPEAVAAQLRAEGLIPGQVLRVMENTQRRIRFWSNGDEHVLAPLVAAYVEVQLVPEAEIVEEKNPSLDELEVGERAEVIRLSPRVRGPERRRLMDLGVLPGTIIDVEMVSPSGDPTGYRIRDALIALRDDQAQYIKVNRLEVVEVSQ